MRQVHPGLWVGDGNAYRGVENEPGWAVIHAAKEPYHRAMLGYKGRATDKTHPEYLYAIRGNRMALNLIDTDDPKYISPFIIDAALRFIDGHLGPQRVLVHCNQGHSRAPSLAMAWLAPTLDEAFDRSVVAFTALYPEYFPKPGFTGYLRSNWRKLHRRKS